MADGDIQERLRAARHALARSTAASSRFVKAALLFGGSLVAGLAQFLTWGAMPGPVQVFGIAGTVAVFLGAVFVFATEQDASAALRVAEDGVDRVREAEAQLGDLMAFEDAFDRLGETYRMCLSARGALEQACVGMAGDVDDLVARVFGMSSRSVSIAAGFAQKDRWTLGVYKAVGIEGGDRVELRCIAHDRAIKCELGEARSWPEGVGIAGIAYTNKREIIVPDLRQEGVKAVFGPRGMVREYDAERYVSMISVPIRVEGRERPWGVVNATSDQPGHFSADGGTGFKNDEPVRALAAFFELIVAMADAVERARGAPATAVAGAVGEA